MSWQFTSIKGLFDGNLNNQCALEAQWEKDHKLFIDYKPPSHKHTIKSHIYKECTRIGLPKVA